MKKLFFVLFASAAFSYAGCGSGGDKHEVADTTSTQEMVNEAMDSVAGMAQDVVDSAGVATDTMHN